MAEVPVCHSRTRLPPLILSQRLLPEDGEPCRRAMVSVEDAPGRGPSRKEQAAAADGPDTSDEVRTTGAIVLLRIVHGHVLSSVGISHIKQSGVSCIGRVGGKFSKKNEDRTFVVVEPILSTYLALNFA